MAKILAAAFDSDVSQRRRWLRALCHNESPLMMFRLLFCESKSSAAVVLEDFESPSLYRRDRGPSSEPTMPSARSTCIGFFLAFEARDLLYD